MLGREGAAVPRDFPALILAPGFSAGFFLILETDFLPQSSDKEVRRSAGGNFVAAMKCLYTARQQGEEVRNKK